MQHLILAATVAFGLSLLTFASSFADAPRSELLVIIQPAE